MSLGKFFSWGESNEPAPSIPADTGNIADAQVAMAREKVNQDVAARKRGRPSKDSESLQRDKQIVSEELARQLDACYDPKAWGALLALPADAALAITARENWKISKDERDALGASGSAAARTLMFTNPRTLAFLMLASALFSVYVPRAVNEFKHQAEKRKNESEKKNKVVG